MSELIVNAKDSQGNFIPGITICALGQSGDLCAATVDSSLFGQGNWIAEIQGGQSEGSITISPQTDYIIHSPGASNSAFYNFVSLDTFLDLSPEGSFSVSNSEGASTIEIISAQLSSVTVGSGPFLVGNPLNIDWSVSWLGSSNALQLFPSTSKVELIDGLITIQLSNNNAQTTGTGSFQWTPGQVYSGIRIRLTDNDSGSVAESSSFDVAGPSVEIIGPELAGVDVPTTWSSYVTNATAPFTYLWDYMPLCGMMRAPTCDVWHFGGTSANWTKTFSIAREGR